MEDLHILGFASIVAWSMLTFHMFLLKVLFYFDGSKLIIEKKYICLNVFLLVFGTFLLWGF